MVIKWTNITGSYNNNINSINNQFILYVGDILSCLLSSLLIILNKTPSGIFTKYFILNITLNDQLIKYSYI